MGNKRVNLVIAEFDYLNAYLKEISLFEIFKLNSQSKKFLDFDSREITKLLVKTSEQVTPKNIFQQMMAKFTRANLGTLQLVLVFLENQIDFIREEWAFFFGRLDQISSPTVASSARTISSSCS